MSKLVQHVLFCGVESCPAQIKLEILGPHELRSVGQEIEDVAVRAGWGVGGLGNQAHTCPDHAPPIVRVEMQRRERIEREVREEVRRRTSKP